MISSTKINNRKKDVLVLGKGPTQGLEHTLSAEKIYSINFTENKKKICQTLHYNRANNYLFINGTEINKFIVNDSEIVELCYTQKTFQKSFQQNKTGLNGYVCDFSIYYDVIVVDNILDIHKYLIKKNGIV